MLVFSSFFIADVVLHALSKHFNLNVRYIKMLTHCFRARRRWWCPTFISPGFQLNSSLLFQSQEEAPSAASLYLRAAVFLSLTTTPRAASIFHTHCAGKPLQPSSTNNSQACHPLSLHCSTRSWYSMAFLSEASSHPSSHRTMIYIRMIFSASSDHRTMRGLSNVWMNCGKCPPSSPTIVLPAWGSSWSSWRWLAFSPFLMILSGLDWSYVSLTLFPSLMLKDVRQCSQDLIVSPSIYIYIYILHPVSMCANVPLPPPYLQKGCSLIPHLCRFVGVERV